MSIPISSMMHADVQVVGMDDSIAHIEHLMKQHQLSWVPVRDGDGPVLGVVSAADLVQFHAQQRDADHVVAWQLCTYKPITVEPDTPVAEVARLMVHHHVHHVVVMQGGVLRGVVSALDFVRCFAAEAQAA